MSITRQEPGSPGLVHSGEAGPVQGDAAPYGGEKSPLSGQALAPLRQLIDDRLPACCWSVRGMRPGGCG